MKTTDVAIGSKINRWTVLEDFTTNRRRYLRVKCDCGTEGVRSKSIVVRGKSKGCTHCKTVVSHPPKLGFEHSAITEVYHGYKSKCTKKDIVFELDRGTFAKVIQENCFYCGDVPANRKVPKNYRDKTFLYNGLDRVVPSKGYISDNVVACCKYCNRMKSDLSNDEFFQRISKIANRRLTRPKN